MSLLAVFLMVSHPVSQLRGIYVRDEEHADTVSSWFPIFPEVQRVPVEHKPEVYR